MNIFLKRLRNIGVTLIMMIGVYEYAQTTITYQARNINIETDIPECGDDVAWEWRYIAYKDLLILGTDRVYKKQDKMYQLTNQTLSDMTQIEEEDISGWYRQCKNLIVAEAKDKTAFLVYDMDTASTYSYPLKKGREISDWYIHEGGIYYTEWILNDNGDYIRDNAIRKMNPENGESIEYYRSKNAELDYFWFYIRKDGIIFCEWGGFEAGRWVYWKIQSDADGKWTETKLCEIDRWEFREAGEFNEYGLFVNGQLFDGAKTESVVIKDSGDIEMVTLLGGASRVYLDNGYLMRGDSATRVTFYDYTGNAANTYRLIDEDYIENGYELQNLIYCDNIITGLYVQEDTKELYIAQVRAELE